MTPQAVVVIVLLMLLVVVVSVEAFKICLIAALLLTSVYRLWTYLDSRRS